MRKYFAILFLIMSTSLFASIGKITKIEGSVEIKRDTKSFLGKLGSTIEEKDTILTNQDSKAVILLNDNTLITIGRDSSLNIKEYLLDETQAENSKAQFNFFKGAFKSVTGKIGKINPSKFKLKTKNATIGIRGTTIIADQNTIIVMEGSIFVLSKNKQIILDEGYFTKTIDGKIPSAPKEFTNKELDSILKELHPKKRVITFTTENKNKDKTAVAKNGEVVLNEDGSITYTVDENFKGEDTITVTSTDSNNEKIETIKIDLTTKNIKLNLESVNIKNLSNTQNSLEEYAENSSYSQEVNNGIQDIQNSVNTNQISRFYLTKWDPPSQSQALNTSFSTSGDLIVFNTPNNAIYTGTNSINLSGSTNLSQITSDSTTITYGNPNDSSSFYYINDDYFGTKSISNGNTGWMQAVYDGYSSGSYSSTNNNTSWGYWLQETSAAGTLTGLWVSGKQYTLNIGSSSGTINFAGKMMGKAKVNSSTTLHNILMDSNNAININVNLGSGATTGNFAFNTANNLKWSGSFSATATNTNFIASSITVNTGSQTIENVVTSTNNNTTSESFIKGTFYGSASEVQSIGGSFNFANGSNTAYGVYIADKK